MTPAPPARAALSRLQLLPARRALPRGVRPFPDETAGSYLDRLAAANCLDSGDLRAYLAGDRRAPRVPVSTAALAVLAALPEQALRRAVPELCSPAELGASRWAVGRARPHAAVEQLACRRCAATRGVQRIARWATHEQVLCLRHQLWTSVWYQGPGSQLDLRRHPEITAANRQHRRLIRRLGRPAVHFAFEQARRICAEWHEERGMVLPGLQERLDSLGCKHRLLNGDPAGDAALYPHAVALARLLACPGWMGPVLDEHPSHRIALGDLDLAAIDAEVERHRPGAMMSLPWDEIRFLREAVLLAGKPGTRRLAREVRRTIAPGYAWLPLSYYNRCEPLAEWVRDRAGERESAFGNCRHRPPPSEVYTRAGEATRLMVRYHIEPGKGTTPALSTEDLAADLAAARDLIDSPPEYSPGSPWDALAAVAAAALEAGIISGAELPAEALRFAAETVIRIGEGAVAPNRFDGEYSFFEQGAHRSAARALPLLLLPGAAGLRAAVNGGTGAEANSRAAAAALRIARSLPNEVRVHLARGLDRVWEARCTGDESCHHRTALRLAVETMRDCASGPWSPITGRRTVIVLEDPVDQALPGIADTEINLSRLDAAIRALAPAAQAGICVSGRARELLAVVLAGHRRCLLAHKEDMDHRGTHALIAARAVLTVAADGDDTAVREHIRAYANKPAALMHLLQAISAAAGESPGQAETAARIWPSIVTQVIDLHEAGHTPFHDRHYGKRTLAALIPSTVSKVAFLYRELADDPLTWWQPLRWQATVERWLPLAQGDPACIDNLIGFLRPLAPQDQALTGLPWIARLVLADPTRIASRIYMLPTWLIEIRQPASDLRLLPDWQRVVNALVIAGVARLAPYSE